MASSKQTKTSFYQRSLPTTCIAFSSERGKQLLIECLPENAAYFPLSEQFNTQSEPAYCGLSTLVMVLNALRIDPKRHWKGPWRWFHEGLLDCCVENEVVLQKGITLDEFSCLAACNGAIPKQYRIFNDSPQLGNNNLSNTIANIDIDQFRSIVKDSCFKLEYFLVVSYHRGTLGQTGSGHFSPLAAYHEKSDYVLILDVARFKYPPHWVPLSLLFEAMEKLDPETNKSRGFVTISQADFSNQRRNSYLSLTPSTTGCWTKHFLQLEENFIQDVKDILLKHFENLDIVPNNSDVGGRGEEEDNSGEEKDMTSKLRLILIDILLMMKEDKHAVLFQCVITSQRLQAPIRACCSAQDDEPSFECLNQIKLFRTLSAIVHGSDTSPSPLCCGNRPTPESDSGSSASLSSLSSEYQFPKMAWVDKSVQQPETASLHKLPSSNTTTSTATSCCPSSGKPCLPEPSISLKKTIALILFGGKAFEEIMITNHTKSSPIRKSIHLLIKKLKQLFILDEDSCHEDDVVHETIKEEIEFLRHQYTALTTYAKGCPSFSKNCKSCGDT